MKQFDPAILAPLAKVFEELTGSGSFERDTRTQDFCLHMTDWIDDIQALISVMENPEEAGDDAWRKAVHGFLIHAPAHIDAAAKLAQLESAEFEIPASADASSGIVRKKAT